MELLLGYTRCTKVAKRNGPLDEIPSWCTRIQQAGHREEGIVASLLDHGSCASSPDGPYLASLILCTVPTFHPVLLLLARQPHSEFLLCAPFLLFASTFYPFYPFARYPSSCKVTPLCIRSSLPVRIIWKLSSILLSVDSHVPFYIVAVSAFLAELHVCPYFSIDRIHNANIEPRNGQNTQRRSDCTSCHIHPPRPNGRPT